ncbi:MAG: ABC transporter permease [Clostridia bacterium]|nr:ABC transporter permease [Clostridia bacterium]
MINLAIRNWRLFIRDRATVLYSLLGVFIIIGLYVLFLGNLMAEGVGGGEQGVRLVDTWIMAGLIAVSSFTTTLGALGTMVEDRDRKISKDFSASPLGRWQIAGGYLINAAWVGFIMSCVTFALATIYIVTRGGDLLPALQILQVLGVVGLSAAASATMLFAITYTVTSNQAFGGISTVCGTLIGFITGIYIPIGQFPPVVQAVMRSFPTTHAAALLRQIMTERPVQAMMAGAPPEMVDELQTNLGIILRFGDWTVPAWAHIAVLAATIVVFFGLSAYLISRPRKG